MIQNMNWFKYALREQNCNFLMLIVAVMITSSVDQETVLLYALLRPNLHDTAFIYRIGLLFTRDRLDFISD